MRALILFLMVGIAHAEPVMKATAQDGVEITLHNERCKLPGISNLPYRAMWTENGKTQEGCFGLHPQFPIFVFYFEDRTAFVIHRELFQRVTGA